MKHTRRLVFLFYNLEKYEYSDNDTDSGVNFHESGNDTEKPADDGAYYGDPTGDGCCEPDCETCNETDYEIDKDGDDEAYNVLSSEAYGKILFKHDVLLIIKIYE